MFRRLKVERIEAVNTTGSEDRDEVYIWAFGGTTRDNLNRRYPGADDYIGLHQGQVSSNITLWDGFVGNGEGGFFRIYILEQDFGSDDFIGRVDVSFNVNNNQLSVQWIGAGIAGSSNNSTVNIVARNQAVSSEYRIRMSITESPVFRIENKNSGKCLDVVSEWLGKANVQQYNCKPANASNINNQRWFIQRTPYNKSIGRVSRDLRAVGTLFHIFANHSGDALDIEGGMSGINLQQYPFHGGTNQRWFILRSEEPGFVYIVDNTVSRAFDVANASNASNANIIVTQFHGGDSQKWKIQPNPPLSNWWYIKRP